MNEADSYTIGEVEEAIQSLRQCGIVQSWLRSGVLHGDDFLFHDIETHIRRYLQSMRKRPNVIYKESY